MNAKQIQTNASVARRAVRIRRAALGFAPLALIALTCCSCRVPLGAGPMASMSPPCDPADDCAAAVADVGPAMAMDGAVMNEGAIDPSMVGPMMPPPGPPPMAPMPYQVTGTWRPPGLALPWPEDEYLEDGGDQGPPVLVAPDWKVYGLEMEDTIVHFDTVDGRTLIEASNIVELYAPRFGAVRTIIRLAENEQAQPLSGFDAPIKLARYDEIDTPISSLQREQAHREDGRKIVGMYRTKQGDGAMSQAINPGSFQDAFLPFENLSVIRTGEFVNAEKARLATAVQAAITWTKDEGAQVIIDNVAAQVLTGDRRAQATFTYDDFRKPKLRIIKVASTQTAIPGETVDFTLRVDNVGTQVIGNAVVMDSLTTRLEYVANSAQASVAADFSVKPNEGDSLVLRWELIEPIQPGEGAVMRFQCVVR